MKDKVFIFELNNKKYATLQMTQFDAEAQWEFSMPDLDEPLDDNSDYTITEMSIENYNKIKETIKEF